MMFLKHEPYASNIFDVIMNNDLPLLIKIEEVVDGKL